MSANGAGPSPLGVTTVVLPTFNRSGFLPSALAAIRAQEMTSWELVVIDDGSTDNTREIVEEWARGVDQSVTYVRQENQGAYGARNTGIGLASGGYIAFYDSDDVWLPHHLSQCVAMLEQNRDVDWVYAATRIVDFETARQLSPTSFYTDRRPRPFLRLKHETRGRLRVITDANAIRCQILHGLFCGLQNSVLRRRVFDRLRFSADLRNEAEDQLFAIRALAAGFRLAYLDDVHVIYQVHGQNSSGSAKDGNLERRRRLFQLLVTGYERLATEVAFTSSERRALRRRIGRELFWHLGYASIWQGGDRREALATFSRALRVWPYDLKQWKTFAVASVRVRLSGLE